MLHKDYRNNLRTTLGSSAAPYGYTLATWTSGAVFIHIRGVPDTLEALGFMVGAVAGFALVGVLAFGGLTKHFDREPSEGNLIWGSFHFFSVGVAIGAATLVAHYIESFAAWPLGGFLFTGAYLLVAGAESTVAYEWDHRREE